MEAKQRSQIDEEAFDKEAQELLTVPLEQLRMKKSDWEKFDKPCPPSNDYVYTIQLLGDIRGKKILDYGCGNGYLSIILAKKGGLLWGFDISGLSVEVSKRRAEVNHVVEKVNFEKCSSYSLGYKDEMFDLIIGLGVLHHVEIDKAAKEIARVLKKGGRAIFSEPFGDSFTLRVLRRITPVKVAVHEGSQERQLTYRDIVQLAEPFSEYKYKGFQLFSRLERVVKNKLVRRWLNIIDNWLLDNFAFLRRYSRIIVIELTK